MSVYIIAELSANHNNDLDLAFNTIKEIAASGADAVKVQTYRADSLTMDVDNQYFGPRKEGLWKGMTPYEVFSQGALPYDWHSKLKAVALDYGLDFFSSPFDFDGVDFLESLDVPKYKIASFEITDIPLIEYVASKGKPIIISTGVADKDDIKLAVETCLKVGNDKITLLKCTSEYPAPIELANLRTIPDIKKRFNVEVGLSDHTMGSIVPITAVALGAKVVEKHFILDRSLGGPDSAFSMEPNEFTEMVKSIRDTELALGEVTYQVSEKSKLRRRSLFASEDIHIGDMITKSNIKSVRPGYGLHPKFYPDILGKRAVRGISKGEPLTWDHI